MPAVTTPTLREARARYFEENHFGVDGGYSDRWVLVKVGPLPIYLPNTAARVAAVRFHDLHHLVTGYATHFHGECEISAWEVASGCGRYGAAWGLNLQGMGAGLFFAPGDIFRAFVRGRHSRNFYRDTFDDALLALSLEEARRRCDLEGPAPRPTPGDALAFAGWSAVALLNAAVSAVVFFALSPAFLAAWWVQSRRPR